jgi:hypothetical protein
MRDTHQAALRDGASGPLIGGQPGKPSQHRGVMLMIRPHEGDEHVGVKQENRHDLLFILGVPHIRG